MINIKIINWHDANIIKVEEDPSNHLLKWILNVDISQDSDGSLFGLATVKFHSVYKYYIDEGVVYGHPTILDVSVINYKNNYFSGYEIRFNTTAGCRIVITDKIEVRRNAPNKRMHRTS
jgi:hypothetical protein